MIKEGHEVDLLTGSWPGAARHKVLEGIRIHRYGYRFLPHVVLPLYLKYHDDADLIVDDMAHAAPWFSPWFSNKPGVVFFRHMHARTLKGQVSPRMAQVLTFLESRYSFIYRSWDFVAESNSSERDLNSLGIEPGRITKIPPGVDIQLFRPSTKTEEPSLVYFGGMRPYKRPEHALMALSLLINMGRTAHLTMVGDGPSLPMLRRLSVELAIDDKVTFVGKVPDDVLAKIVSSSWINIHCSMHEGWGYSMLEAAAAGTPTVAYRVPGVNETVMEGKTGFIVQDGDVSAISNAIATAFDDRRRISAMAREYAKKCSWEEAAIKWEKQLSMAISSAPY